MIGGANGEGPMPYGPLAFQRHGDVPRLPDVPTTGRIAVDIMAGKLPETAKNARRARLNDPANARNEDVEQMRTQICMYKARLLAGANLGALRNSDGWNRCYHAAVLAWDDYVQAHYGSYFYLCGGELEGAAEAALGFPVLISQHLMPDAGDGFHRWLVRGLAFQRHLWPTAHG
ncbi:unnamed protein product [Amoebophrya sp. A25]|nr:unnamed protein product [Amoebophrya sp. A25]|eukprot:GSA25T00000403001.1